MAMLLESEAQAIEVRDMLENGESFTELAGELTLENFSKKKEGDLDWRPEGILTVLALSSTLDEKAFELRVGELSQPVYDEEKVKDVGYWLIKVLEREEDTNRTHVQAILLGDKEKAYAVRNELEAGEDFAKVSFENTEANEKGGDFGWVTPGNRSTAFDEFVFNNETELGVVSEPIRDEETTTVGGYWLIKVVDIDDDKEITEEDRALLKAQAFNDWVADLRENGEVDDGYLSDDKKLWAVEQVLSSLN
jgi:parvulin-like peptidyl-prolyl isomerase